MNNKVIKALRRLEKWKEEVYRPLTDELARLQNENSYLTIENNRMCEMNLKLIKQREQLKKHIKQ